MITETRAQTFAVWAITVQKHCGISANPICRQPKPQLTNWLRASMWVWIAKPITWSPRCIPIESSMARSMERPDPIRAPSTSRINSTLSCISDSMISIATWSKKRRADLDRMSLFKWVKSVPFQYHFSSRSRNFTTQRMTFTYVIFWF